MTPRNKPSSLPPAASVGRESAETARTSADFSLGELFSKRRAELDVTIKSAEKATKIRSSYLEAIEEGRYENLPDNIYTQGYVKNYADFLGFDTAPLLNLYKKERRAFEQQRAGGKEKAQRPQSLGLQPLDSPRFVITPRSLFVVLGVALVGLVIGYIALQLSVLSAPPKLTIDNADGARTTVSVVYFSGRVDESADLFINDAQVTTGADGSFRQKVTLVDGPNQVKITARSRFGKTASVTRTVNADLPKAAQTISGDTAASSVSGGVEVTVRVGPDAATIRVVGDGKDLFNGTMTAGSEQIFRANDTLKISTSNAGSTQLILSNTLVTKKDLGKLGNPGEAKNDISFSKDTNVQ